MLGPDPQGEIGALLLIDIDGFRLTNEVLGQEVGDELLRQVAAGLRWWADDRTTLARSSGDEFAAMLTTGAATDLREVADRARLAISAACRPNPPQLSIGVCRFDCRRPPTIDALFQCASAALRNAKQEGGGLTVEYAVDEHWGIDGAEWVVRAITEDRLTLFSQPIVEIRSARIVRRELLVRALDTDGRLVMPSAFIPVAERFRLMPYIDRWVVKRALRLAAHGEQVSINLSAQSLTDVTPLATLVASFIDNGGRPANLMFEMTETAAIADSRLGYRALHTLSELGCPLALDDFGAGFGCFSYLKHVPAQLVKIDREFIRDLRHSPTDLAITSSIAALANRLGIDTVAEGVEDEHTLGLVEAAGVRHAQGYFLGRPTPIDPAQLQPEHGAAG